MIELTDPEILQTIANEVQAWLNGVIQGTGVANENEISAIKCAKPRKELLGGWLEEVSQIVISQRQMLVNMQELMEWWTATGVTWYNH